MDEIKISIDLNALTKVVQRQTRDFCLNVLSVIMLRVKARDQHSKDLVIKAIKTRLKELANKNDKLVFISEILIHVNKLTNQDDDIISDLDANELVEDIQHLLVRELEKLEIGVDKNAFGHEEIKDLGFKINKIIDKLERISSGQEVIFDRIEEMKKDYEDLLKSFGLGKKPFFQRFAGIVVTYAGEKGADETINILKPLIKDVFDRATNLISMT